MKCTAMAALVFAACLAWGPATGAAPAEKPEKALTGTAAAAAVDASGKAGTVPSVQKDADKAIKAVAPQSDDKTGKADKSDKDGKENKDSKKEMAHVPTDDDCVLLDSLDTLTIPPLQASDFYIGSIHHGDSPAKVKRIFGPPAKFSRSTHYTTMQYNDKDLKMRFTFRNKTADSLRHSADTRKAVLPGAESMFLSAGTNILIGRDVRLKYPAEVLLRQNMACPIRSCAMPMPMSITSLMKVRGKMSCTSLPSATAVSNAWPSCPCGRRTLRGTNRRTA